MRLENNTITRMLHSAIYDRLISFCNQYTPEFPAEPIVTGWLNRVFFNDPNLYIYVDLDDKYKITGHCVIDLQELHGYRILHIHQVQADRGNKVTIQEALENIEKLRVALDVKTVIFYVTKHIKGLEKYGYKVSRTVMLKGSDDEDNQ